MTIEEQLQRLTGVVESFAATVVSHDDRIESSIKVAETESAPMLAMTAESKR